MNGEFYRTHETPKTYVIINLFHLEDPVKEGEKFIKDMINNDQITKNEKS